MIGKITGGMIYGIQRKGYGPFYEPQKCWRN